MLSSTLTSPNMLKPICIGLVDREDMATWELLSTSLHMRIGEITCYSFVMHSTLCSFEFALFFVIYYNTLSLQVDIGRQTLWNLEFMIAC